MSAWDEYPSNYRQAEIARMLRAVHGGDCVSILGLSGAGKSNLAGFLAHRLPQPPAFILVDCNRLVQKDAASFFLLLSRAMQENSMPEKNWHSLESQVENKLTAAPHRQLCLILDRFDALDSALRSTVDGSLRALRDQFKYQLTYITTSRRPIETGGELDELFYACTFWIGPLNSSDATWSARRYAVRFGMEWKDSDIEFLMNATHGYPAFLRAACEALAAGCPPDLQALRQSPPIQRRLEEFLADHPGTEELRLSGLENHPLLSGRQEMFTLDPASLTAKEALLMEYFQAHPGEVCGKDDLIRAVWPEDKVFADGIRDDALAQLIRRLRRKTEEDPSRPSRIQTIPGRGYLYPPIH